MIGRIGGTRFDDRFQLKGTLGHGAMGAVFEVSDEKLEGVRWALKELDLGVVVEKEKAEAVALFEREADILASLNHPGIPRLIHRFTTDKGAPAFVMTKVEGVPLDVLLDEIDRPLSLHEALPIMLQVCHIFEHLHSREPKVVFRDLKPSNLMLTEHGVVVLIDFGIARYYDPKKQKDTQELGTPGFCSPEQYGHGQTTERSDIYAIGSTAYFLLTKLDLQSMSFKVPPLSDHISDKMAVPLSELLASMMQLIPKDRPESVRQVRGALEQIFKRIEPSRDRATTILRPGLRALTEHPTEPKKTLRVFDGDFFKRWVKTFY